LIEEEEGDTECYSIIYVLIILITLHDVKHLNNTHIQPLNSELANLDAITL